MLENLIFAVKTKYKNLDYGSNSWPNTTFPQKMAFLFSSRGASKIKTVVNRQLHFLRPAFIPPASYELHARYPQWLSNETSKKRLRQSRNIERSLKNKPLISVLLVVPHNANFVQLKRTIQSIKSQIYGNWEICIANCNPQCEAGIKRLTNNRIKKASPGGEYDFNAALDETAGEYVLTLGIGDVLLETCLLQIIRRFDEQENIDLLYSDHDLIMEDNKFGEPHFKPDFCEDSFLSRNYLGNMLAFRKKTLQLENGFNPDFGAAQVTEMLLRLLARKVSIHHLPAVLYHMSESPLALDREDRKKHQTAISAYLETKNETAEIIDRNKHFDIVYRLKKSPKVSIIIPSHDAAEFVKTCIDSVFQISSYANIEVILINNNSKTQEFFELVKTYEEQEPHRFQCVTHNQPFNFSELQNLGAEHASGDYLILLNNDIKVITENWIELMLGHAQRSSIGAVGVKLLFEDDTIQHCGVLMGMHGLANHHFAGEDSGAEGYFGNICAATNYSVVTAACLMVSKRKFVEVNGFEEYLEVEFNDVDFCLKLTEAGCRNIYLPNVSLYHFESLTRGDINHSDESADRSLRERSFIQNKWPHVIENDPCYNPNLSVWMPYEALRMDDEVLALQVQEEIRKAWK